MEAEREVKTIEVNIKCEDCDTIMMEKCHYDTLYIYECNRCKSSIRSLVKYPHIKYVPL